jgi:hypothetical protein
MRRAIELGDAWHPNVFEPERFESLVNRFRATPGGRGKDMCAGIGLDVGSSVSSYVSLQGEKRLVLPGDIAKTRSTLRKLERLGVTCLVLSPNFDGKATADQQLRSVRKFAREFL